MVDDSGASFPIGPCLYISTQTDFFLCQLSSSFSLLLFSPKHSNRQEPLILPGHNVTLLSWQTWTTGRLAVSSTLPSSYIQILPKLTYYFLKQPGNPSQSSRMLSTMTLKVFSRPSASCRSSLRWSQRKRCEQFPSLDWVGLKSASVGWWANTGHLDKQIHSLKKHLKNVALGKAFVLQGGMYEPTSSREGWD